MNKIVTLLNSILASIIGVIAPLKAIILIIVASVFIDFCLAIYHAFKKLRAICYGYLLQSEEVFEPTTG